MCMYIPVRLRSIYMCLKSRSVFVVRRNCLLDVSNIDSLGLMLARLLHHCSDFIFEVLIEASYLMKPSLTSILHILSLFLAI